MDSGGVCVGEGGGHQLAKSNPVRNAHVACHSRYLMFSPLSIIKSTHIPGRYRLKSAPLYGAPYHMSVFFEDTLSLSPSFTLIVMDNI